MSKTATPALSLVIATLLVSASQAMAEDITRSVKVTGTAIAKVRPDIVVWTIHVTSANADLEAARQSNDESTRTVLALSDELDVDAKDVQTGRLQINKVFQRDRSGNQGAFRHYSFRRTIGLRQRDIEKFDDVLQRLTPIGNVEVSYSLESSEYHNTRSITRRRAVKIARQKAEEMTMLLGATLGHVLTIDETAGSLGTRRGSSFSNVMFDVGTPAQADDVRGTFAPGSIEIRVSVDIAFAIE